MASDLASILLGGVLTLSGTFFVHAYQRYIERKRLCSALSVEIQQNYKEPITALYGVTQKAAHTPRDCSDTPSWWVMRRDDHRHLEQTTYSSWSAADSLGTLSVSDAT